MEGLKMKNFSRLISQMVMWGVGLPLERDPLVINFNIINDSKYVKYHRYISAAQLNILNTNMQGKEENILTSTDKMKAFQKKLQIWKRKAVEDNLEMSPLVSITCINETLPIIVEHLTSLEEKVSSYFPSLNT